MPYRRNSDGTYTRWTYRQSGNGTYSRVPDPKPGRGASELFIWPFIAVVGLISAGVAGIAHHPHTALKVAAIVAASLGVIGLLVLIGYIARDRNRVDKGIY